jgi:hypothetical protein
MSLSLSTFYDYETVPFTSSVKERCANESMHTPKITVTVYFKTTPFDKHFKRIWIYPEDPEDSRTVENEIERMKGEIQDEGNVPVNTSVDEERILTLRPERAQKIRETRLTEMQKARRRKRMFENQNLSYEEVMKMV